MTMKVKVELMHDILTSNVCSQGILKQAIMLKKISYLWTGYITFYRNVDTISKDLEATVWTPFD